MTFRQNLVSGLLLVLALVSGGAAVPAQAVGVALPIQCETGRETVLPWDDLAYDLHGTCGVVRVTADHATVTMPAATQLVLEGTGNTVAAKPLGVVSMTGPGNSVTAPSIRELTVTGAGSSAIVSGLVERAVLGSSSSTLAADTVNVLRLEGSDTATARKAYRTRVTGADNVVRLTRSDRLVLTGDRNHVVVARGRTTMRDRGEDNVLDLRPRRR